MSVVIKVCKVCDRPIGQGKIWMTHLAKHAKEGNEWARKELEGIEQLVAFRRRQREQTSGIVKPPEASISIEAIKVPKRHKFQPKSRGERIDQLSKNMAVSIGRVYKSLSYRQGEKLLSHWDKSPEDFEEFATKMVREARRGLRALKKLRKLNASRLASTQCERV